MRVDLRRTVAADGTAGCSYPKGDFFRTHMRSGRILEMNTKLKSSLVAIAAATLGLTAYGCGGGGGDAAEGGGEETTGGEASCSGGEASCSGATEEGGEASCSGATEGAEGAEGAEGDGAGGEASCGAGSCGG